MNEITTVNQTSLEFQGAMELHTRIITSGNIAATAMVEMCKNLKQMRDRRQYIHLGYNTFEGYCEQMANIKARQAYTYISTIERLGESVLQSNAGLGITKLELLAQLPEDKRDEVADAAAEMSTRELKEKIAELTKAKEQLTFLQDQVDETNEINETLANQIAEASGREKELSKEVQTLKDELEMARRAQPIIVNQPEADPEAIRKEIETKMLAQKKAEVEKIRAELEDEMDQAKAESFEKGKKLGFAAVQGIEAEKAAALKMAADLEKKLQTAGSATVEQIVFGHLFTEFQEQYNKLLSSIGRMDPEVAPKYRGAMAKFIGMMTDRLEVQV
jgi:chromosome segregation ATPase